MCVGKVSFGKILPGSGGSQTEEKKTGENRTETCFLGSLLFFCEKEFYGLEENMDTVEIFLVAINYGVGSNVLKIDCAEVGRGGRN